MHIFSAFTWSHQNPALANLSLVCRVFYSIAQDLLYKQLKLFYSSDCPVKLRLINSLSDGKPRIESRYRIIREISFHLFPYYRVDSPSHLPFGISPGSYEVKRDEDCSDIAMLFKKVPRGGLLRLQ